jgi:hypothetical protein
MASKSRERSVMSRRHTLEPRHDLSIFWPRHNSPWPAVAHLEPGRQHNVDEHRDDEYVVDAELAHIERAERVPARSEP